MNGRPTGSSEACDEGTPIVVLKFSVWVYPFMVIASGWSAWAASQGRVSDQFKLLGDLGPPFLLACSLLAGLRFIDSSISAFTHKGVLVRGFDDRIEVVKRKHFLRPPVRESLEGDVRRIEMRMPDQPPQSFWRPLSMGTLAFELDRKTLQLPTNFAALNEDIEKRFRAWQEAAPSERGPIPAD